MGSLLQHARSMGIYLRRGLRLEPWAQLNNHITKTEEERNVESSKKFKSMAKYVFVILPWLDTFNTVLESWRYRASNFLHSTLIVRVEGKKAYLLAASSLILDQKSRLRNLGSPTLLNYSNTSELGFVDGDIGTFASSRLDSWRLGGEKVVTIFVACEKCMSRTVHC